MLNVLLDGSFFFSTGSRKRSLHLLLFVLYTCSLFFFCTEPMCLCVIWWSCRGLQAWYRGLSATRREKLKRKLAYMWLFVGGTDQQAAALHVNSWTHRILLCAKQQWKMLLYRLDVLFVFRTGGFMYLCHFIHVVLHRPCSAGRYFFQQAQRWTDRHRK